MEATEEIAGPDMDVDEPVAVDVSKPVQPEIQEEIKMNGDMNGAYEEMDDASEESQTEDRPNGEVATPSHENGVEKADDDVSMNGSEPDDHSASESDKADSDSGDKETDNHKRATDSEPEPDVQITKTSDGKTESFSLLSSIKGVEPGTPMSKELEDLSKIGARGSLEITLVKKDGGSSDRKEEKNEKDKMDADVLTITDASKEPLNLVSPEKKNHDDDDDDDEVIVISPDKSLSPKKKRNHPSPVNITPRRSSRNLNKTKSYADKDVFIEDLDRRKSDDDDVEEVIPTDPLADDKRRPKKTTIVVNDTKKLVEIAAGSKQNRGGKKEPTLVIIDTNSLLSGKSSLSNLTAQAGLPQMSITPTHRPATGFSMCPVPSNQSFSIKQKTMQLSQTTVTHSPKPILPSLTDDMYVVEAPSFIVPYVYEKPPVTPLKEYVDDMDKLLKELDKEERDKDRKRKKEKENEKDESDKEDEDLPEKPKKKDDDDDYKPEPVKNNKKLDESKSDTETDDEGKESDSSSKKDDDSVEILGDALRKKSENYFENPLGKFFMQIGLNLVQEHVQTDLLRNQKRKRDRDEKNCPPEVHKAINSLLKTLEYTKENNKPYKLDLRKCELCNFKTESALVMAHHLETPHMRNYVYRCNFCTIEVRSPHDILFHMEAEHNVRGRLERAPAFHQCPSCPFEDNQKGKLSRHLLSCAKKYKPERNQEPPLDWEPPAKIPRIRGARPGMQGGPLYHSSLAPRGSVPLGRLPSPAAHSLLAPRGRGRPPIYSNRGAIIDERNSPHHKSLSHQIRPGVVFRPSGTNSQPQVLIPSPYNSLYQKGSAAAVAAAAGATAKLLQQPSISITPLPRQSGPQQSLGGGSQPYLAKPGRPPGSSSSKTTFVICEICDGYIKDLEQLRNHMQWIHKVKIHPKMIYNRPPLNCQKCQFRFFTDQGLERHLLGSHGLVTSSMQEAANKGKDGGRCPVCGRVYQWKLLNHVARDHNMSLKPAHLSYKCTVCTATFSMYKQFESHVYSAHSVVAKRVMDKKPSQSQPSTSSTSQSDSLMKPLKINDEITIIPQPARAKTKSQLASSKTAKDRKKGKKWDEDSPYPSP